MYELDEAITHGEFQKLLIIMGQYTTGQKQGGADIDDGLTTILLDNMHLLHYALSLHDSIYARDIVEPCTLAPLLELLAEGAERQGLLQHALSMMRYAQRVCERTLGVHDEQSIRISFQVLRLQLRASSTPEVLIHPLNHPLTHSLTQSLYEFSSFIFNVLPEETLVGIKKIILENKTLEMMIK